MLTNDGFKKALAIVFSVHSQLEPKENKEFIYKAWYRMFQDISDSALLDAAVRFVTENPKLFPGDSFIAMIRQLAKPVLQETEGDVVELAFQAVRDFGYMRERDAMEWLKSKSPLIAASVRRIGYLELCRSEEPDVIRGQLRAIFKSEKDRSVQAGGIVESATHLNNGQPDNERLLSLTKNIGKSLKVLPGVKHAA